MRAHTYFSILGKKYLKKRNVNRWWSEAFCMNLIKILCKNTIYKVQMKTRNSEMTKKSTNQENLDLVTLFLPLIVPVALYWKKGNVKRWWSKAFAWILSISCSKISFTKSGWRQGIQKWQKINEPRECRSSNPFSYSLIVPVAPY